jgi:hypothetical protein
MHRSRIASISAEHDAWLRRAIAAAIAAAKDVVGPVGIIPPSTRVEKMNDAQWTWLVNAAIWGWVSTRGNQAASEGWDLEETARRTPCDPDPWDVGAVMAILPALAETCGERFDWSKPSAEWSKESLAEFLLAAFNLIQHAFIARDIVERRTSGTGGRTSADVTARQANGTAGNPRLTPDEVRALGETFCPF